jgi:hypothetical protein
MFESIAYILFANHGFPIGDFTWLEKSLLFKNGVAYACEYKV